MPDLHIYVRSKLPWVVLPEGTPAFDSYYDSSKLWPPASLERNWVSSIVDQFRRRSLRSALSGVDAESCKVRPAHVLSVGLDPCSGARRLPH